MKITPLEIRQKAFEKEFRGFHKEEVQAFLHTLSLEWEKMMNEIKESHRKVETLEKEVNKLKEVESSLYKTLKTAEDTGANMIDQANKMAEIHMKETEVRAEAILNDAKNKAHDTIEEAEMIAKETIDDMEDQLKSIMHAYKTLENFRDDLISDIKSISNDALDRVERLKAQKRKIDLDDIFIKARRDSKKAMENRFSDNARAKNEKEEQADSNVTLKQVQGEKKHNQVPEEKKESSSPSLPDEDFMGYDDDKSFFDEID